MNEAERLTKLEERYAHLQRHLTEQDKAMLELSDELGRLRKELQLLRGLLPSPAQETGEAADERPPHY
jgi:SlyX protein